MDVTYPCFCTRKQIAAEIASAVEALGQATSPIYPGTCRTLPSDERARRVKSGEPYALRLDIVAAKARCGQLTFTEEGSGPAGETGVIAVAAETLGDIVLARRDAPAAYHVAVVVDDAFQRVELVTRGNDLFAATHVQRVLQALLGLPEPRYAHHRLVRGPDGAKLSKRDGPTTLRDLRSQGWRPSDVRDYVERGR